MSTVDITKLRDRPYWLPGTVNHFRCGDWIARYTANVAAKQIADGNTIDISKAAQRLGGTSFLSVMNRAPWFEKRGDMRVLTFGRVITGTGSTTTLGVPGLTSGFDADTIFPTINNGSFFPGTTSLSADDILSHSFSALKQTFYGLPVRVGDPTFDPIYHGQCAITFPGLNGASTGGTWVPTSGSVNKRQKFAYGQAAARIPVMGIAANATGTKGQYHQHNPMQGGGVQVGGVWTYGFRIRPVAASGATLAAAIEDPLGTTFRGTQNLLTGMTDGIYSPPIMAPGGSLLDTAPFHGLHRSIDVIAIEPNFGEATFVCASFSKADIVALVTSQRDNTESPGRESLTAMLGQLNANVTPNSRFKLMVSANPIPVQDIYESRIVMKALAAGVSQSDIDDHMINGKKLINWRTDLMSGQSDTKVCLWLEGEAGAGIIKTIALKSKVTTPYIEITAGSIAGGDKVAISAASYAEVKAAGMFTTDAAVDAAVEANWGCEVVNGEGRTSVEELTSDAYYPWESLPDLWLKRGVMKDWQPLANSLCAAILEPVKPFLTAPPVV